MTDIIKKYFSDPSSSEDYGGISKFFPAADLDNIKQVEKLLAIKFPEDYIAFLRRTNGYNGKVGQSYSIFLQVEQIERYTKEYGGEIFPWIVFIGTDGGNEMYVIDTRDDKMNFGILPYIGDKNDFISLGSTFEIFVDHLYHNDFWKK
ncbi:MAG: hypothetical protein JWR61_1077 [Ferruginibacter sp.]|uniref:SMI1/KNR4 family protein n=1 Tax=Ferruginibacter sp. TaxID=1940288 RepID=UPI00265A5A08|nr:SMI1/KNR4 family protein [Ferruginibacter sp.]MDB5276122.1 hypothetical protein [Ferruginibacter sp.]